MTLVILVSCASSLNPSLGWSSHCSRDHDELAQTCSANLLASTADQGASQLRIIVTMSTSLTILL
jgi:hypothetical protein